ncbi:MAG: hypothetical protein FE78DRAFT_28427 [Acidomyces sp. 'richmondensis']|nr:MAG: hypothetical protein FE78DRAFT_28427 [Acidomyces sp. 'richmondensis']
MDESPILIIGAGITGLVLAHALKARSIPFKLYERDSGPSDRRTGWALYLHWCLGTLRDLIPLELFDKLLSISVDPDATKRRENGTFPFFNLRTGDRTGQIPSAERLRVSREKLRTMLMDGIVIEWGKQLDKISIPLPEVITERNENPAVAENSRLPIRLLGVTVLLSNSVGQQMKQLDPFCFQGADPRTNSFLFFSFLDTPSHNDRSDNGDNFACQIIVSWPFRRGFLGSSVEIECPDTHVDRLNLLKDIVDGWAPQFRNLVQNIPDGSPVHQIRVEDWIPQEGLWSNLDGKATLMGDAAHAMTMYRGEAANHAITDVRSWVDYIFPTLKINTEKELSMLRQACKDYEEEMIPRSSTAVRSSRKACLDAHGSAAFDDK